MKAAEDGYKKSDSYPDLNWKFRILTAEARIRTGQNSQALDILQSDPPANLSQEIFLRRRIIQAYAHCYMNEYDQADHYFQQAETIQKENGLNEADLDYFRGRCELNRRAFKKTDEYLLKALNTVVSDNLALKTLILINLGWSAKLDLRNEDAVVWLTKALTVARILHAPILEEQALGERGDNYTQLYDFANAEKDTKEALDIARRLKVPADEQKLLLYLGVTQHNRGDVGNAEVSYKGALDIAKSRKDIRAIPFLLDNLTTVKIAEKDVHGAEQYFSESAGLVSPANRADQWKLNDARISSLRGDYTTAVRKLNDFLQELDNKTHSGNKVFFRFKWEVELNLGRNYAAMGDAINAEKWFLQSIDYGEQATQNAQNERYQTTIRDNIPIYDGYIEFLLQQNRPEKALQVAQQGRARSLLAENKPWLKEDPKLWLAGIQRVARKKNIVLLSYYATESNCYLWVITPAKMKPFTLGISQPSIAGLSQSYRAEIQSHLPINSSPAAKHLFQVLVQPALQFVPKGSHVMVLADSAIYNLEFDTLISSEGGDHYWIDDVDLQYASSIDLLLQAPHAPSSAEGLLLIGAPTQADPNYGPLPHAPEEMESVRKHFAGSDVVEFPGSNATPESYTLNSPGRFKYIHFATHGTADNVNPMQSAIILSADKAGNFKLPAKQIADPSLRLHADLVTISACEGTGTQVQSLEGLLGLEWAFMRAGARQVVAALWDVDDTVTPGLMDNFYDGLKKGETAAEALRHAKLKILHNNKNSYYAVPYYWAPLQVYTRN